MAEIKPSFHAGHLDVAQTCAGLGRDEEAATVYRRLLEIMPNYLLQNPDDVHARLIYASKLGWAGRKEEAIPRSSKCCAT